MDYKYNKLRGRIVEKYGTFDKFAEAIGMSNVAVSKKLNGKIGISQEDIEKWSALLDISLVEYGDFYFT